MERQIRRYKREYLGMKETGQDTAEASVKLRTWREREKDFLRQTGLMQQLDREQVVGFSRSEAGKATWTASVATDMFRQTANKGSFAILPERMRKNT